MTASAMITTFVLIVFAIEGLIMLYYTRKEDRRRERHERRMEERRQMVEQKKHYDRMKNFENRG